VAERPTTVAGCLLDCLEPLLAGRTVADLRLGLLYVAVRLNGGGTGVAHVLAPHSSGPCRPLGGAGALSGRSAQELAHWVSSRDPVEASVGLAVLNAAAADMEYPHEKRDIRDLLAIRPSDKVAMIGYFAPLLPWLRKSGAHLDILEMKPVSDTDVRPAQDAAAVLPDCDVALITATAIINHTVDHLLGLAGSAREVVLLGPSTPMVPQVFAHTPVTLLAGVEVVDAEQMLRIVSEGGSTRQFGSAVRKLCARIPVVQDANSTARAGPSVAKVEDS
jgi:uncharacterized protein (DUF4213/DUF364 family)